MKLFDARAALAEIEVRRAPPPEPPPFAACPECGGLDWWKPGELPPDGPGWRCVTCDPPGDVLRHACAVPPP